MKTMLITLCTVLLAISGYITYNKYSTYTIYSPEETQLLHAEIAANMYRAYVIGAMSCAPGKDS